MGVVAGQAGLRDTGDTYDPEVSPKIGSVVAGQARFGDTGDSGDSWRGFGCPRQPIPPSGVGGELPVSGHPLAGLLHALVAEAGRVRDRFRGAAGVLAQVPQDRGPGVTERVLSRRSVEQGPGSGFGDEPRLVIARPG